MEEVKLKVKKHVTESEAYVDILESTMEKKQKTLADSPMSSGKSTLVFKKMFPAFDFNGIQLIYIAPMNTLLEQNYIDYQAITIPCFDPKRNKKFDYQEHKVVVSTPDSLHKVVKTCEKLGKQFFIVYDELHVVDLNYSFRKNLVAPLKCYEHDLCVGMLGITATSDTIMKNIKWDKVFKVEVDEKFYQTDVTQIITGVEKDEQGITNHINKVKKAMKCPVFARINDKKLIEKVKENLVKLGYKVNVFYRDNESQEDNELFFEMLKGSKIEYDVILLTSLIDNGVNLNLTKEKVVIDFAGNHSTLIEDIQFLGRFRNSVTRFDMVLGRIVEIDSEENPFRSLEEIKEIETSYAQELYDLNKKHKSNIICSHKYLKATKDEEGYYSYEIDMYAINEEASRLYMQQIVSDPKCLKKYLENHSTFNSRKIRIVHCSENYSKDEKVAKMVEEHQLSRKAEQEQFEKELSQVRKDIKKLTDEQIEILLTKDDLIAPEDNEIYKSIEDLYYIYHSNDYKEYRHQYHKLKDYKHAENYTDKELILLALDNTWFNKYRKQCNFILGNQAYDDSKELRKTDPPEKQIVYAIRNTLNRLKGKERKVNLSGKFLDKFFNELRKEKCLEKASDKTLTKHLSMTYNISKNAKNNNIISSVKARRTLDI